MVKSPMLFHEQVKFALSGVSERRMSKIVGKCYRLGKILIQPKRSGHGSADRGNFDGVGQTGAIVIPFAIEENLGLSIQTSERSAVNNAIPIALKAGAEGMFYFRTEASGTLRRLLRIRCQKGFANADGR
jgi:hypothetical protein